MAFRNFSEKRVCMFLNTPKRRAALVVAALISLIALIAIPAAAQQSETPTPAPSKTPTLTPTLSATETAQAETVFEPLTQADLNILTGNVQRPNGIAWFDGMLYTACTGDSTLYEINDTTGATVTYIWGVRNAHALHVETDENDVLNLWVPDYQSNSLQHITRGNNETIARGFAGPWGIVDVDQEYFLISNLLGGTVERVTREGERETLITDLSSPTGIVRDSDFIYVANNGSSRRAIEWFPLDDTGEATAQPLVSGLQSTTGLQLAADGNLYFAYSLGTRGVVGRVNPAECRENGGCTNAEVEIVLYTELAAPLAGLAVTPDMRLFVHTMFSPDIYWVEL
jgi:hypothetical protein